MLSCSCVRLLQLKHFGSHKKNQNRCDLQTLFTGTHMHKIRAGIRHEPYTGELTALPQTSYIFSTLVMRFLIYRTAKKDIIDECRSFCNFLLPTEML